MIRCAMLRHAEMPKGSRRVPTVYDGFILGLPHGAAGRLLLARGRRVRISGHGLVAVANASRYSPLIFPTPPTVSPARAIPTFVIPSEDGGAATRRGESSDPPCTSNA